VLYRLAQILFRIYFFVYHRISIEGLGGLRKFLASRKNAPVILAANHESYLDPPLVGMLFPGPLRFVAWDGLFKFRPFGVLIGALGAVPVSQQDKNSAASLLRDVINFIKDGFSVLIFPEGERSPDGNMLPLSGGVSLISLKTGTPIVPVWIEGTFEAYPLFRLFPRPYRVSVTFGEAIFPEDLPDDMPDKERRETLLDALERALKKMRKAAGKDSSDQL
jgi:1-acyl-sn-glycerol-3-phosphate acyltransferase